MKIQSQNNICRCSNPKFGITIHQDSMDKIYKAINYSLKRYKTLEIAKIACDLHKSINLLANIGDSSTQVIIPIKSNSELFSRFLGYIYPKTYTIKNSYFSESVQTEIYGKGNDAFHFVSDCAHFLSKITPELIDIWEHQILRKTSLKQDKKPMELVLEAKDKMPIESFNHFVEIAKDLENKGN